MLWKGEEELTDVDIEEGKFSCVVVQENSNSGWCDSDSQVWSQPFVKEFKFTPAELKE